MIKSLYHLIGRLGITVQKPYWGTAGIRAKWDTMQSFVNILAIMQTLWF